MTRRAQLCILGAALVCVAAVAPKRVTVAVTPRVLIEGDSVRITCRVEPDDANRYLEWGVDDYRASRIELDGANAARTHQWVVNRVPCDVGPVFCRLRRTDEKDGEIATLDLQVVCRGP